MIALEGELGSGKTTFVQKFLKSLGVSKMVTSPTFVIMKRYLSPWPNYKDLYHIDCYRIKDQKELLVLGFGDIVNDSRNLVLIEWADMIKEIIPEDAIWIKFRHGEKEGERTINIGFVQ